MNVFLRVNVTFYDAVNMNYEVIRTDRPCPCTAKLMFVVVRNICNEVGRIDNFQALARKI